MTSWPVEMGVVFGAGLLAVTVYPLTLALKNRPQAWATFKHLMGDLRANARGHLKDLLAAFGASSLALVAAGLLGWDSALTLFLSLAAFLVLQMPSRFFFRLQYPAVMTGRQGRAYRQRARTAAGGLLALFFVLSALSDRWPSEPGPRRQMASVPGSRALICQDHGKNSCPSRSEH